MFAGTPFKVSGPLSLSTNTFPTFGFPINPFPPVIGSSSAMITGAETVIVTIAESQFNGLSFSQI